MSFKNGTLSNLEEPVKFYSEIKSCFVQWIQTEKVKFVAMCESVWWKKGSFDHFTILVSFLSTNFFHSEKNLMMHFCVVCVFFKVCNKFSIVVWSDLLVELDLFLGLSIL